MREAVKNRATGETSLQKARLVEHLTRFIREQQLQPGDRLPSERALAEMLGTSRSTLRCTLSGMATAGLVEIRRGSGAYVAQHTLDRVLAVSAQQGPVGLRPYTVLEARVALEPPIAGLSARKATPEDMRRMRSALEVMEHDIGSHGTFTYDHDREFHQRLAEGAHNSLLEVALRYLYALDNDAEWLSARDGVLQDATVARLYLEEHIAIFEAVRTRRSHHAETLMSKHSQRMLRDVSIMLQGVADGGSETSTRGRQSSSRVQEPRIVLQEQGVTSSNGER